MWGCFFTRNNYDDNIMIMIKITSVGGQICIQLQYPILWVVLIETATFPDKEQY